jgi:hypothetical protein
MLHGRDALASVILLRCQNQNRSDLFWNVEAVNRGSNLIVGRQPFLFELSPRAYRSCLILSIDNHAGALELSTLYVVGRRLDTRSVCAGEVDIFWTYHLHDLR